MTRRRRTAAAYGAGFFTSLMRAHDWPPGFVSRTADHVPTRLSGAAGNVALGGWGNGTLPMPGTPKHTAPGWADNTHRRKGQP